MRRTPGEFNDILFRVTCPQGSLTKTGENTSGYHSHTYEIQSDGS